MSKEKKETSFGAQFVMVSAIVFIVMGLVLLFVPQISVLTLCYILSAIVVAAGVIMIVKYFMTDAYRNLDEYGFSEGVLMLILGSCALVRASEVSAYFVLVLGIFATFSSVVKIQYALDLKRMEDKMWGVQLGIGLVLVTCAILIIINPFEDRSILETFTYYVIIIDGAMALIGNLYLRLRVKRYEKKLLSTPKEEEPEQEMDEESENFACEKKPATQEDFKEEVDFSEFVVAPAPGTEEKDEGK